MGPMTVPVAIEMLESLGCVLRVEGERLKVRGPNLPQVAGLVSELRARREEAIRVVQERGSAPPTLEEVKDAAAVPNGHGSVVNDDDLPF